MGAPEVELFLTDLAVNGKVSSATQTQALSALLFLYREVLDMAMPWMDGMVRAKPTQRIPTVLSVNEVHRLLACLNGVYLLMARLIYGTEKGAGLALTHHSSDVPSKAFVMPFNVHCPLVNRRSILSRDWLLYGTQPTMMLRYCPNRS